MLKRIKKPFYFIIGLFLLLILVDLLKPSPKDNSIVENSKSGSRVSFVCSLGGEKSKIKISGNTATETTAAGIVINYYNVNKTNKGAYTLEGSSKQGRSWFIGAQSYLLLDTQIIPYNCR